MTVTIHPTAEINVTDLQLGEWTVIHAHCRLEGTKIHLGRETILDRYTVIGGGSAFDPQAELVAGDFLMTGMFSQINIGRPVHIGDEFGLGIQARVFTHTGVKATRWAPFSSPVRARNSLSSAMVREGVSGMLVQGFGGRDSAWKLAASSLYSIHQSPTFLMAPTLPPWE